MRLIRLPIGKSFTDHGEQGRLCASIITPAKPDAVVIAEIELGKVAVEVPLGAMLVDALHPALEHRE